MEISVITSINNLLLSIQVRVLNHHWSTTLPSE